jgi:hypothetical protein
MKIKTVNLTDAALDWAVCEATGLFKAYPQFRSGKGFLKVYGVARNKHLHPSTDWSQGGPIIEREKIRLDTTWNFEDGNWSARIDSVGGWWQGDTPLVAAMRCYVVSKLGDEIEIPDGF